MSPENIRTLQAQQFEHDRRSHPDILCLPVEARLKHMVLHFAKYVGRLSATADIREDCFRRTLVDTFIIVMCSANALGLDLSRQRTVDPTLPADRAKTPKDAFVASLAINTGQMAKACEALDHLEAFPFRKTLEEALVRLCAISLATAEHLKFDLVQAVREQWSNIDKARQLEY